MNSLFNISRSGLLVLFLLYYGLSIFAQSHGPLQFKWDTIQELPEIKGARSNPGVAGAFCRVHNEVLIVAVEQIFRMGPAWEGGGKVYQDEIYVLHQEDDQYVWDDDITDSLPMPIAYGLSVTTKNGLFCIGGMTA